MKAWNGIGPLKISANKQIEQNPDAITEKYHLLAIDFPCGVGFVEDRNFKCPPLPKSSGNSSWVDLAQTLSNGLKQFFAFGTSDGCDLKNLNDLPFYIWSEGFGSNIALYLKERLELEEKFNASGNIRPIASKKVKGILLGDPMIDLMRQNQNFASFSVSRRLDTNDAYREYLKLETTLQLKTKETLHNHELCEFYSTLFKRFDTKSVCPYDVTVGCPLLSQQLATSSCQIFTYDPIEADIDNPVTKLLIDKMRVSAYQNRTYDILWNSLSPVFVDLYDDNAVNVLARSVNSTKVLLFQSQNNFAANSISLMLFADTLRWASYAEFIKAETQMVVVDPTDMKMRYSLRAYGNYFKAQTFQTGGLNIYRSNPLILRDHIFSRFFQFNHK